MIVTWGRCAGQQWCDLKKLNLEHQIFDNLVGVYIVWHGGPQAAVVRVGQGNIRERLKAHRVDPEILQFESLGLFVTWANVGSAYLDGVERFLAENWKPKVGARYPDVRAIEINSPWE